MQLKVFSVRDQKASIFNAPFYAHTPGEAERNFTRLAKDSQSMINQFPEDYDLYELGTYDDQTGLVTSLDTPRHLVKAVQVKDR